jgi:hypothetical protein
MKKKKMYEEPCQPELKLHAAVGCRCYDGSEQTSVEISRDHSIDCLCYYCRTARQVVGHQMLRGPKGLYGGGEHER